MKIHPEKSEHSFFNKELIEADSKNLLEKACKLLEATDLHFAASIDEVELINWILEGGPTDIDCRDKHGQTPLHYAALRSCEGAVEALLSRGSRIDLKNNDGDTAFDLAMRNPHEKIIEMIVKRKLHLESNLLYYLIQTQTEKYTSCVWKKWRTHLEAIILEENLLIMEVLHQQQIFWLR